MFATLKELAGQGEIGTDICIVGAGPAGVTLATELARAGREVVLLESGGREFSPEVQDLAAGPNLGRPYFDLDIARLKFLGGTTNHWEGWCAPLSSHDFAARPHVEGSGWPIGPDDLAGHFAAASRLCDLGPPDFSQGAYGLLGMSPLPFDPGKLETHFFQFADQPVRFGEAFGDAIEASRKLTAILHATVLELRPSERGDHVQSVLAGDLAGNRLSVRAGTFVLACGAVDNARLLLLSDSVVRTGLGNGHDLVGRYFMEHPHVRVAEIDATAPQDLLTVLSGSYLDAVKFQPTLAPAPGYQAAQRILNCSLTIAFTTRRDSGVAAYRELRDHLPDDLPPEWDIKAWRVLRDIDDVLAAGYRRYIEGKTVVAGLDRIFLYARSEQAPNPDSRVQLTPELDALGQRRAGLNWALLPIDRHTVRQFTIGVGEEFMRLELGRVRLGDWLRPETPDWSDDMEGGYHHMGTTRMAADPRHGVVDRDCRVFGIDNLYVAGSSVFATSGYANPTYTILLLALRLADHLKSRKP